MELSTKVLESLARYPACQLGIHALSCVVGLGDAGSRVRAGEISRAFAVIQSWLIITAQQAFTRVSMNVEFIRDL